MYCRCNYTLIMTWERERERELRHWRDHVLTANQLTTGWHFALHPRHLSLTTRLMLPRWSGQWPDHREKRQVYSWTNTVRIFRGSGLPRGYSTMSMYLTVSHMETQVVIRRDERTDKRPWRIFKEWHEVVQFQIKFCSCETRRYV